MVANSRRITMDAAAPAPGAGGHGLRVVVTGASGNTGTSMVRALAADPAVGSVLGVVRRLPDWSPEKTSWVSVDLGRRPEECRAAPDGTGPSPDPVERELAGHFAGADVVVHLAWLIQPARSPLLTWRTNVLGGLRVFRATVAAGVPALVHASSVGAYSPGPKDRAVDESWPTHGWPEAAYCREKAYLERCLDTVERENPHLRVVRMRPGFLFKEEAAAEQRRLFMGPFVPGSLVRPGLLPVMPALPGLRFQALHTDDAAEAYRLAAVGTARGAFNLAAEPVVDAEVLADLLGARVVRPPLRLARAAVSAGWYARLTPASPRLFDAVLRWPLMDTTRAREELGWAPERSARDAVAALLGGLRRGAGFDGTAPLARRAPHGGRLRELRTGVGRTP